MTKYYTLLTRDDNNSPWEIMFSDYDKECVCDEQDTLCDNGEYSRRNTRIICTGDEQVEINARVAALNGSR